MPSPLINNNILPIILLIDTSGNDSIATAELNDAMSDLEKELTKFDDKQIFEFKSWGG